MSISIEHAVSRPLGVAQGLVRHQIDEEAIYSKVAILTGDSATLATQNGRWSFFDALRLLSRIVGNVVVAVPSELEDLRREVEAYHLGAWSRCGMTVIGVDAVCYEDADAILSIGTAARPELPWTAINSNGWIARVSSGAPLPSDADQPNPVAALMAASLGVTEVFKRIFEIPEESAPLLDRTEFSLYEMTTSPTQLGPPLPARMQIPDTLLTGAGAIGNAIALLLAQLGVEGRLHIIDRQRYRDENMGTCLLMEAGGWLNEPKAPRLAEWLKRHSPLDATAEEITIESAINQNRFGDLRIDLVLNGLDDSSARRETQRLWPSLLVDGGINEIGAAVTQYRLDRPDSACIMCWFEAPQVDEKTLQSRWTGLHRDSLADAGRQLCDEDIVAADESKRQWLREQQRLGKTVCSIITEAQLAARLGIDAIEGFRPSVPFVASAAASLVLGEALKALYFPASPAPAMFQIGSLFLGPEYSTPVRRLPTANCQCVLHRGAIERMRIGRKQSTSR